MTDLARRSASTAELSAARLRIVEVARSLFSSRGYERTPLRAIADALGLTKAAVYHHFRAKEDLLAVIVAPLVEALDGLVAAIPAGALAPLARRNLLRGYADELAAAPDVTTLLLRDPVEFGQAHPDQVRETAVTIAIAVLDSGGAGDIESN